MNLSCKEIEVAVSSLMDTRRNIIVPNISWGAGLHECDLLIINPKSGWASEVEIKISKSDLRKDFTKGHDHINEKISHLYYAIPESLLEFAVTLIPSHAGIIICKKNEGRNFNNIYDFLPYVTARYHRSPAPTHHSRKLTQEEIINICRLGCMRIWNLKRELIITRSTFKK